MPIDRKYQNKLRTYEPPKKKHREFWYLSFGSLLATTETHLFNHINGMVSGSLTPNQFGAMSLATLSHSHSMGYSIGANSVGNDLTPAEAQAYINSVMTEQAKFLEDFINQLEENDPRYIKTLEELYPELGDLADIQARIKAGEISPNPIEDSESEYWDEKNIQERMKLYVERVRGTANWGAVDMLSPTEEIYWRLDNNENHCDDCPARARITWFKGTLPGVPGDGSTDCLTRCRCWLETTDGQAIQF